jgi:hypothetical protein
MEDFQLKVDEPGVKHAFGEGFALTVVGDDAEVFHRRTIKMQDGEETRDVMLVARVGGVSLYVRDGSYILTAQDLYL